MFQPLAAVTDDLGGAVIKMADYFHKCTYDCDSNCNFSSDCMQTTGQWCQANGLKSVSVLQSFTALLPVQLS